MKKLTILILIVIVGCITMNAQTKEKQEFYINKAQNDTLKLSENWEDLELIPIDKNLKVVSFEMSEVNGLLFDEAKKGNKFSILKSRIVNNKKPVKCVFVQRIVATDGKKNKTYKGFTVYLK